jgi:WD40 repeat protein
LWDVEIGKVVAKWTGHTSAVWTVCWSIDGERVLSGCEDGTARVLDAKSGKTVLGPIKTGHQYVYAAIYSPDTTKIATGGYNENGIKIWDARTSDLLFTVKHEHSVWTLELCMERTSKKLITGSRDGSIRIFDTATWQQIMPVVLQGHQDLVKALS